MDKNKAKNMYHFDATKPVLAILGGSQGSVPFNRHFHNNFKKYIKSNIQILWQCGKADFSDLKELNKYQDIHILPFTENMDVFYSAADLVVSRAGALALSEMALLGKAMVIIPLPKSAGNHQTMNAQTFAQTGCAILVHQTSMASGSLEQVVLELIQNSQKIDLMETNCQKIGIPNATEKITTLIMEIAEG